MSKEFGLRLTLRNFGADVYIRQGSGPLGIYHCKAAIVDRRALYSGNAHFTFQSHNNEELVYKMKGPDMEVVLQRLAEHRLRGRLWQ